MDISNVVAVITGGTSGLGEATARHLIARGAKGVVSLDIDEPGGVRLAKELGDRFLPLVVDISESQQVDAAIQTVVETFGSVNTVVAAAGIAGPAKLLGSRGPIALDKFDRVMRVNLYGAVNVMRAAGAVMLQQDTLNEDGERGVFVLVSSGAAYEGQVGQVAYSASKAALVGMTLPLARELGPKGIRVVTIAPGAFDTPIYNGISDAVKEEMVGVTVFPKRLGRSEEFAMFVEELLRNRMHNARTYRFDAGVLLPVEPGKGGQ